jgi:hypothetical protein
MKLALTLAALLCSSLPGFAQQSELDKLREDVEKLKAESAVKTARIQALEELLKKNSTPAERAQLAAAEQAIVAEALARANRPEDPRSGPGNFAPAAPAPSLVAKPAVPNAPKALEGKVTAVANEIGLVVVSIGAEDGVKEGDEFTVYRNGDFVSKIRIDRTDRKWCTGKVVLKKDDPRVMDAVSNHIYVSGARGLYRVNEAVPVPATAPVVKVLWPSSSDELKALRKELDEVRNQVRQLSDHLIPSWQDAGVSADEASEELRSHLGIPRGLVIRRVREGSAAEKAGLKANDVVPNTTEAQLLDQIAKRLSVTVIRKGQQTLVAPK